MKIILCAALSLAALAAPAVAGPTHVTGMACPMPAKTSKLICPVTGAKIASVKAAVGHSIYKGKTYYFCCPACKPAFDKRPAYFVQRAAHGNYQKM